MDKPSIAVHKFTSCDGCQLAFLNLGEGLLELAERVEIRHFAEAGPVNPDAEVDIAFIEGSVSTPDELARVKKIRQQSQHLITIGACANTGGIQALRNGKNVSEWVNSIYASPAHIETLEKSTAVSEHVRVDFQLWGCPVNRRQVTTLLNALLLGAKPVEEQEALCLECKRNLNVCVMVTQKKPCLGPVTRTGCGALCPQYGRACYACYGPSETSNTTSMLNRFEGFGLQAPELVRLFQFINSNSAEYQQAVQQLERPVK